MTHRTNYWAVPRQIWEYPIDSGGYGRPHREHYPRCDGTMTIKHEYACDLCKDVYRQLLGGSVKLIGLYWAGNESILTEKKEWRDAERHICVRCLSALQSFARACGQGFRDCSGGPQCSSDHK